MADKITTREENGSMRDTRDEGREGLKEEQIGRAFVPEGKRPTLKCRTSPRYIKRIGKVHSNPDLGESAEISRSDWLSTSQPSLISSVPLIKGMHSTETCIKPQYGSGLVSGTIGA